jgi:hypothetical protein
MVGHCVQSPMGIAYVVVCCHHSTRVLSTDFLPSLALGNRIISFFFAVVPFMGSTASRLERAVDTVAFFVVYFSVVYFAKIPRRPDEATRGYSFGLLLVGISYMLEFAYNLLIYTIAALLYLFTSLWESLTLATLYCISRVRSRPNREGTGTTAYVGHHDI